MEQGRDHCSVVGVAAATAVAVHRRDHDHPGNAACCRPHAVEVVQLGQRAVTVCHDCRTDSGFLPQRQAERLAEGHRRQTDVAGGPLPHLRERHPAQPGSFPESVLDQ